MIFCHLAFFSIVWFWPVPSLLLVFMKSLSKEQINKWVDGWLDKMTWCFVQYDGFVKEVVSQGSWGLCIITAEILESSFKGVIRWKQILRHYLSFSFAFSQEWHESGTMPSFGRDTYAQVSLCCKNFPVLISNTAVTDWCNPPKSSGVQRPGCVRTSQVATLVGPLLRFQSALASWPALWAQGFLLAEEYCSHCGHSLILRFSNQRKKGRVWGGLFP